MNMVSSNTNCNIFFFHSLSLKSIFNDQVNKHCSRSHRFAGYISSHSSSSVFHNVCFFSFCFFLKTVMCTCINCKKNNFLFYYLRGPDRLPTTRNRALFSSFNRWLSFCRASISRLALASSSFHSSIEDSYASICFVKSLSVLSEP